MDGWTYRLTDRWGSDRERGGERTSLPPIQTNFVCSGTWMTIVWDTDKGKFERLCLRQYVCVGICVIHCLVCSMLAQTARFAGARTGNINGNKRNLSEVGSISATDPALTIMCLATVTCVFHIAVGHMGRPVSVRISQLWFKLY